MHIKDLEEKYHEWDFESDKHFRTYIALGVLTIAKSLDKLTKPYEKDHDKRDIVEEAEIKAKPKRAKIG